MTAAQNPASARVTADTLPVTYPCGVFSPLQGAFPFVGTAGQHLARVERAIERQRKAHGPVADLLKRRARLKARVAALGAQHG